MKMPFVFSLIVSVLFFRPALATEIVETGKDSTTMEECSLSISGEIGKGDAARIAAILAKWQERSPNAHYKLENKGLDYVVCLSGSGGDYLEAIKIAEIFDNSVVATSVPVNASCLSACAIAFMGGRDCCVEMGRTMMKRHLSVNSTLGLGAPTLSTKKASFSSQEISDAFDQSLDVITALQNKAEKIGISANIINKLIAHRNGDVFEIKPDPKHQFNYVDVDGKVFQDIWVP